MRLEMVIECKTTSSIVMTGLLSNGSFEKRSWPSKISIWISTSISSLIFSGTNCTARSRKDETRNARRNADRNSEWWGNFSPLQFQIKPKSQFEFLPRDSSEFKSNQKNLNSPLYREIPRDLIFSILTSWVESAHHSGFRLPFNSAFRVSSSTERAVQIPATGSPGTLVTLEWVGLQRYNVHVIDQGT